MMRRYQLTAGRWCLAFLVSFAVLVGFGSLCLVAAPALQNEVDVSPEATPEIRQVKPNQAPAGSETTIEIEGRNFSRGAYVSFSNPAVQVVSTRRASATQLEAKLAIGRKAPPGTVSLYVSNPAGAVAEAPFTIGAGAAPPTGVVTAGATGAEIQPSGVSTPEVTAVVPPRAIRGSEVQVKISGKNFARGAQVGFSNSGIRVLQTKVVKSTEVEARIQVAADAPSGPTSLFVVNPGDREAEVPFEVAEASPARSGGSAPTGAAAAPATATTPSESTGGQRFEVFNLGEGISILQELNKPKGTLTLAGGKLKYEEAGKEIFSAAPGDLKEIDANTVFGVSTGTFHILLKSGKTFNFAPASLRPADTQSILEALRRVLK